MVVSNVNILIIQLVLQLRMLTPKGPLVPMGTNRFWAALHDLTLFLDFLKLFVKMCLVISFVGVQKLYF
jgi:hypothetical protein